MDIVSIFCTRQLTRLRKYDRWKSSTLQGQNTDFSTFLFGFTFRVGSKKQHVSKSDFYDFKG